MRALFDWNCLVLFLTNNYTYNQAKDEILQTFEFIKYSVWQRDHNKSLRQTDSNQHLLNFLLMQSIYENRVQKWHKSGSNYVKYVWWNNEWKLDAFISARFWFLHFLKLFFTLCSNENLVQRHVLSKAWNFQKEVYTFFKNQKQVSQGLILVAYPS